MSARDRENEETSSSDSDVEAQFPPRDINTSELKSQSQPLFVSPSTNALAQRSPSNRNVPLTTFSPSPIAIQSVEPRPRPLHRTKEEHIKLFKTPKETTVALLLAAEKKASLSRDKFIFQSFMSGVCISIGGTVAIAIGYAVPWPGINRLIFASLFPIGLLANCVFGCELFTGNTMVFSLAGLQRNVHWSACLMTMCLSWIFNWAGCVLFAWLLVDVSDLFDPVVVPGIHEKILALGIYKNSIGFGQVLLRAIPCNFLVCMAVFMYTASEDFTSKILSVYLPVLTFIASGWEHSVANMFFCSLSIFSGSSADYGTFIWKNLIPATIGNFIGGGLFVGAVCWYMYAFGEAEPLKPKGPFVRFSLAKVSCLPYFSRHK